MILVKIKKLAQTFADLHGLTQTCTDVHKLALYFRILAYLLQDDIKGYCRIWDDYKSFFWKMADNNNNTTKVIPRRLRFADAALTRKMLNNSWMKKRKLQNQHASPLVSLCSTVTRVRVPTHPTTSLDTISKP